jgi:energy-coupling factor transport system substrate-specific component
MGAHRRHYFSLHELLIMVVLAALGGTTSSLVSWAGRAIHVTGLPCGGQFLAGAHVLWLVLAVGLVRRPGAATVTGLLKGAVEIYSGNPHGPAVLAFSLVAGVCVDAVFVLLGRRPHPVVLSLAGGVAAASNVLVGNLAASVPDTAFASIVLLALASVAFASGAVLGGLLGHALLRALARAGVQTSSPVRAAERE